MAHSAGLDNRRLTRIVDASLLVRPIVGAFHASTLIDCIDLRVACLRLVVPDGCVVTDRTAGWLHGATMVLAPNSHLVVPRVSVFHIPGNRLRNTLTASGERSLLDRDVVVVQGIRVTTPIRTACDLGRLLHRDSSFAGLDAMLRLGLFSRDSLIDEVGRFKGYRGVRQLRAFAPLADSGSESFGESVLRLRWYSAGLSARPETQVPVTNGRTGQRAFLDLGAPESRYAAEYDGEQFHGAAEQAHDSERRAWLRDEAGWIVDVFRREDLFGRSAQAISRLSAGLGRAKVHLRAGSAYSLRT
ncbi:MAG TPA: hypothetical protein VFE15_04340 [Marmoricola sp.]|nr:hypothetical protein [Marmoricola sp.]